MEERHSRTAALLGEAALARLAGAHVLLIGLGGVGGYALEALVRAGIGALTVIDGDTASESNLNRQLLVLEENIGQKKVELALARARAISHSVRLAGHAIFINADNIAPLLADCRPDYIVDAIDDVPAKIALACAARDAGIPLISSMGTGNKVDPARLKIGDIAKTHTCPLARAVRARLRAVGISHLPVLWSDEPPHRPPSPDGTPQPPASVSYLPAIAGLMLASHVIFKLAEIEK